jgi:hypothetical protein
MRDGFQVTYRPIAARLLRQMRWVFTLLLSLLPVRQIAAGEQAAPQPVSSPAPSRDASPVRFITPTDGQAVKGAISIAIEIVEGHVVDHVSISAGGSTLGVMFAPPYEVAWNTLREADGPFLLIARARGKNLGEFGAARINVTVDNTPPMITWVSPNDGDLDSVRVMLEE